jgi:hypothetical protein
MRLPETVTTSEFKTENLHGGLRHYRLLLRGERISVTTAINHVRGHIHSYMSVLTSNPSLLGPLILVTFPIQLDEEQPISA